MGGMKMEGKNRLVVADAGWAETIPEWLLEEVKKERMVSGFVDVMGKGEEKVGLAETAVYLYTLSLKQPMNHNYSEIYLCLTGKLLARKTGEAPDFCRELVERGLTPNEQRELDELKSELYKRRGEAIRSPLFDALKELKKEITRGRRQARKAQADQPEKEVK